MLIYLKFDSLDQNFKVKFQSLYFYFLLLFKFLNFRTSLLSTKISNIFW